MRRLTIILAAGVAAVAVATSATSQTPAETPFPSPTVVDLFVAAQTVTAPGSTLGAGVVTNFFPRRSTVVFRVFAGEAKTGKVPTGDDVKYAYIKIPNQPNVKLTYTPAGGTWPWTATWTVPADYPLGLVNLKVLFKSKTKKYGSFVQIPVATSQLTVTA